MISATSAYDIFSFCDGIVIKTFDIIVNFDSFFVIESLSICYVVLFKRTIKTERCSSIVRHILNNVLLVSDFIEKLFSDMTSSSTDFLK